MSAAEPTISRRRDASSPTANGLTSVVINAHSKNVAVTESDSDSEKPTGFALFVNTSDRTAEPREPQQQVRRRKRSSSFVYEVPNLSADDENDQLVEANFNANWVNYRGAWLIHVVLIAITRVVFNALPLVNTELSWTLTNLTYMAGSFLMFHWVTGIPFDFNAGAYDQLTMWEQLDQGDQYTPAKKYLVAVPIILFLITTHYTHLNLRMFIINLWALIMVIVPKLPVTHRKRIFGFTKFDLSDNNDD